MSDQPLAGVRVLVPRAAQQASMLSERIRARGGEPVEAPVLTIEPGDGEGMHQAARRLAEDDYALVCLTSPNGVDALAEALRACDLDGDALAGPTVACVGPGTAARLRDRLGVEADVVPEVATTRALGEAAPAGRGHALLPRADQASPVLTRLLEAKGWTCDEVVAYRTGRPDHLPDEVLDDLADGRIDLLAFASSSTARNFATLVAGREWHGAVVSIGPVTTGTCQQLGIPVTLEAEHHDLDGLVQALEQVAGTTPARGGW